jgi:hypothetical protein
MRTPSYHTAIATSSGRGSKYPPAKLGALGCEPLKAAMGVGYQLSLVSQAVECLTVIPPQVCANHPHWHQLVNARYLVFAFPPRMTFALHLRPLSRAWWLVIWSFIGGDRRKCQTSIATPAEPGELLFWFRGIYRALTRRYPLISSCG